MAKVLKVVAVVAGVVALSLAVPGVGSALGLSAAQASTIVSIASVASAPAATGSLLKPKGIP